MIMVFHSLHSHSKVAGWSLAFFMLVALILSTGTSWAQQTGQVTGRITDADSKEYLPGANVMLSGTGMGASTDRSGLFRIFNVPVGDYEIVVRYIGYEQGSVPVTVGTGPVTKDIALKPSVVLLSGIQVTGLRQGQNKALNIQKSSDNIVNVVAAEQMLQLPDLNTAEILQRIPGISIVRDQGEGRYVQIRGTDARLTSVSVNGERITAPDNGERYVGMDVISASQAAAIEVVKALTPDMDGDAIGGSVNLVTKSGFDSDKQFFNIQAGSGYSDMLGKPLWQGNFTYGTKLGADEKFAIAITGNYDYWKRNTNDLETGYDKKTAGTVTIPFALVDLDLRDYIVERERFNVAANLDFRPNENNQYFVRGMFNNRDDYEYRRNLYVRPSKGTFTAADAVSNAKIYRALKDRLERQNITTVSVGGLHKMSNVNLDYSLAYTNGGTEKKDETDPTFVMLKKVNLSLDQRNPQRPQYAITNVGAAYDQFASANYKLDNVKWNNDKGHDRDYLGAVNLKYSFDIGNYPSQLKVGGKMHIREKMKNQDRWVYNKDGADLLLTDFVGDDGISIVDGAYKVGSAIDGDKFREYFKAQKDKTNGLKGSQDHENSEAASFKADENIVAYYAMNTLNMDNWMFLVGVRHEFTSTTNNSHQVLLDANGDYVSTTDLESKVDYNNLLPMVHIRYKLSPMTNIRLAFTTGMARPNFYDLVPYRVILPEDNQVNEGNSALKPTKATNLDLMGEHYFQAIGMISGGVFYKKLDDIIFTQTTRVVGGTYDGWYHSQPVNGGSSTLIGYEINWQQQLTFLPGVLNGLGVSANFAHTKSTADVGGRLERSTLPGQAENVANFAVSYEKYGFSGRFSISYNGSFIEEVGEDADHDRIYKNHMQMDFSASQQVFRGLEVYLEVINLNKEPMIYYMGQESRPLQQEYYSWWMHAGVKFELK
jgi:TonB-dependent receptor